ncbi:hypothetical protein RMSM_06188 [Rhodopirellula maiorica SM1]|uniref:Uncharacterized protein n=1 Tax=Rhodopirellula maiorica SM1 TaxID=1265738 RepID=M5RBM6_9BACT|nr:hypothetical protein RMSM_06188 [Rhodopirellula maiorica SM1]
MVDRIHWTLNAELRITEWCKPFRRMDDSACRVIRAPVGLVEEADRLFDDAGWQPELRLRTRSQIRAATKIR